MRNRLIIVLLQLVTPIYTFAAGYGLLEQSAEGLGVAFAGAVTGYGDGSSAYFNPAAMSSVDRTIGSVGTHFIFPSIKYQDRGSTVSGFPNNGGNGPNAGGLVVVPNAYYVKPLDEKVTVGFTFNVPFGLVTDYDDNWSGRYQGSRSELTVLNLSTSAAYRLSKSWSIGASIGAYYADTYLSNAIDFGTIGAATLGLPTATALGLAPQQNDGFLTLRATDWAFAWGLGASYSYGHGDRNRIGLSYKPKVALSFHGDTAEFDVPASASILTAGGSFVNTPARAGVTLPESASIGMTHWLDDQWALLYESQWTRWSRFEELRIEFDNPLQPDGVTEQDWDNAWRHSIGLKYMPGGKWSNRFGFAYDQTPVPDRSRRTPRIPDNSRYWLAIGTSYQATDQMVISVSYAHLFLKNSRGDVEGPTGDRLIGEYSNHNNTLSASVTWSM